MSRFAFVGACAFLLAALVAAGEVTAGPIICYDACARSGDVHFDIVEGIPDKKSWDFAETPPATRFTAPAFALVGLPKKYNERGVIADRQAPFVVRGKTTLTLSDGEYRVLLRSRGAARVFLDGKIVLETKFRIPSDNGHGNVPDLAVAEELGLALLPPENQERLATLELDGQPHEFRVEAVVGDQKLRPELGELSVSISGPGEASATRDEPSFKLLSSNPTIPLSESRWAAYKSAQFEQIADLDSAARRGAARQNNAYWEKRHQLARDYLSKQPAIQPPEVHARQSNLSPIDRFLHARRHDADQDFAPLQDDYAFLRRLSLDTVGVIPNPQEIAEFVSDNTPDRRDRAIDRLLADPRWADHWTSYWQDVLAENPGILKPELNNTGAFRWWIYESLLDNKPFDRFATELVMMEGSAAYGGPAGFGVATQNDAPLAEKAHVLAKAFLAVELKCARCHDAPYHPFKQSDTFALAAMLDRKAQKLPKSSTVPLAEGARKPLINISLKPGETIDVVWPFGDLVAADLPEGVLRNAEDSRERFAALLTSPANQRFAEVIVNRVWTRYIGWGLVSSADDWHNAERPYPELLEYLARDFVENGYDLKRLARTILASRLYQSQAVAVSATNDGERDDPAPLGPARRRMTAEQIVDSLFSAVDKPFKSEELTFDPAGRSPARQFGNLGHAHRAWQFTSLSNERDRPALSMPAAQSVVDLLVTFGWRESRQNPLTIRDEEPNALQPLLLAQGVVGSRITTLSDDSAITRLATADGSPDELVQAVYLRLLSRLPRADEMQMFVELLHDGFAKRRAVSANNPVAAENKTDRRIAVAWSNHLSPDASRIKLELERAARAGDPPTTKLVAGWRERMEDMVWALVNSPEFVFIP